MKRVVLSILAIMMVSGLAFATGNPAPAGGDEGPVSIDWFVNEDWFNYEWDLEKPVAAYITDNYGIEINFQNSAGGGTGTEKINAMIAADDLTDVVTMGWWYTQFQDLQAANMLQKLDEVIPKYTPGLWEAVPEFMVNWYTHTDGHWYGFANMFWAKEQFNEKNYLTTNAGMVARKDVMDQLGITADDFKTQDGMLNALRKVRDADIQYNGLDMVPLYFTPNGGFPGTYVWAGMFGIDREDANGNWRGGEFGGVPLEDPKSLEQLLFANKLYQEGLLSRENWTSDRSQISEKIVSGSIFAMMLNVADYQGQYRDLFTADNTARMVPVGPIHAKDMAEPYLVSSGLTGWLVSMISTDTQHLEKILKFWEFLYSKEGLLLSNYGFEGDTYTLDETGSVVWTQKYLDLVNDPNVSATAVIGNESLWLLQNSVTAQQVEPAPANEAEKVGRDVWAYFGPYAYNDTAFQNLGPFGGTEESVMQAEINVYMEEQIPRMVLAASEAELRAIYAETIEQLKKMGIEAVRASQNEQFQLNKAKVGQQFAWPPLQ
jgi:putative aldouronate transport system substrate-binding protein